MSENRRIFGIRVVCFIAGMCVGGILAGFKMQDSPAEGQETGKTFVNYLTQVRMEYIKEQLRCTDKSIEEICHEAGYKDTHYFYALFKKREGCTPTDYRMQRER